MCRQEIQQLVNVAVLRFHNLRLVVGVANVEVGVGYEIDQPFPLRADLRA